MMAMERANCSASPMGDAAQPCQPGVTIGVTMRRPRHGGCTSAQAAVKFRLGLLVRSFSSFGLASASPSGALPLQKLILNASSVRARTDPNPMASSAFSWAPERKYQIECQNMCQRNCLKERQNICQIEMI